MTYETPGPSYTIPAAGAQYSLCQRNWPVKVAGSLRYWNPRTRTASRDRSKAETHGGLKHGECCGAVSDLGDVAPVLPELPRIASMSL